MPHETSGYFMSLDVPLYDFEAICRITQTILPATDDAPALVLDIEVQKGVQSDPYDDALNR